MRPKASLGIDFTNVEQRAIIILLGSTTAFYLFSFHVHSRADYRKRLLVIEKAVGEVDADYLHVGRLRRKYRKFLAPTFGQKLVDTKIPKLLGLFAVWSVLYVNPKFSPFYEVWAPAGKKVAKNIESLSVVVLNYQKDAASNSELWGSIGRITLIVSGVIIGCVVLLFAYVMYDDYRDEKNMRKLDSAPNPGQAGDGYRRP